MNLRHIRGAIVIALIVGAPAGRAASIEFAAIGNQTATTRPANAAKVDAIAQQFKGTHDLAGAAEALANATRGTLIYGYGARADSGLGLVQTTTQLLDQRELICYEFVHVAGYLAGNQRTSDSGVPRLGPSAGAAYMPRTYTTWDGASVIPRGQVIVFVARAYNNDAGYYHIGISLGAGKMIHFPAEGGVQTTDVSSYYSRLYHSEVRVSDYNWMSAQGDTYEPTAPASPAPLTLNVDGLDIPNVDSTGSYVRGSVAAYFADREMQQVSGTLELGAHDSRAEARYSGQLSKARRIGSYWWGHDEALNGMLAPALQKAAPLPASQGMSILQYGNTQTVIASASPPWREGPTATLARVLFVRTSSQPQASPALPNVKIFFQSTGRSSGAAMTMTVVNLGQSPVNIVGSAFALEPINLSPQDLRRELQRFPTARQVTTTLDGYCMDFAKAPPAAGVVYRLANANAQAALWPLRHVTTAVRRLSSLGALHRDTTPAAYDEALMQWSVWTHRERFNRDAYERAFVEHGRKNLEGAGRKWTKEIEVALRARAANRWPDIVQVLRLAAEIGR